MALRSGTKLGPYEIRSQIGAGGMGEVYSATDTRLDRTVAIKILPEHLAKDPQRRERFEREAKAVSSLNHPHICTLHDVGEQDGTHYLVMELVEGNTLAAQLEKGRLPLDQALEHAIQIADALDKAHRQGIVHRDLKPGNIMVTKAGVKLLDFGLAKLKGDAGPASTFSQMPTADDAKALTAEGTIIGTLQYMAPEQLEGKDADSRTDIFAFGAVVYEMVTGKKAFEGKSQASLISSIMSSDPQSMSELQQMTPASLDYIVRTCLSKDPDERWQSASDLRREVNRVAEVPAGTVETAQEPARRIPLGWASAVALLALVAALAVVMALLPGQSLDAPEMRVDIDTPATSDPVSFALSPDGRQLVFVASGEGTTLLWLRSLDADTSEPLPGTEGASLPFWSPDGNSIGYFAGAQLLSIDVETGVTRTLASATLPAGGTWGVDGVILYNPVAGGTVYEIPALGGEPTVVVSNPPNQNRHPVLLPGGREFLFYNLTESTVYLGALDSAETRALLEADSAAAFHPAGYLLFVRQGALRAQQFDVNDGTLSGDPLILANNVSGADDREDQPPFSVSASGSIAYRQGILGSNQMMWIDRSGQEVGTVGGENSGFVEPRISPTGDRVAAWRDGQIWLVDIDSDSPNQFTFDDRSDHRSLLWSGDGSEIFYNSDGGVVSKPASGVGGEEVRFTPDAGGFPTDVSTDGGLIFYLETPLPNVDIWIHPLDGDGEPFPYLNDPEYVERRPQLSPNSRWVAYESNELGTMEVYVSPFPNEVSGQFRVSTDSGNWPRWSPDGQELFYIAPGGRLMAVPIQASEDGFQRGTPFELFQTRMSSSLLSGIFYPYDVSRDGRFLMAVPGQRDTTNAITLLLNWNPEIVQ